ncbi:DNA mismatch repair protein Mlh1 [Thecaphora frezii]
MPSLPSPPEPHHQPLHPPPVPHGYHYRPITKLDESVVNKIAAGEIIHRPANALKELIENSLDAGATMIKITLKDGGVKLLQIQDNGSGIRHTDLPLLCERFATSKLRDFSDLSKMTTFGFRGEALASISYVSASMSVVSKTRDQDCAFKAYYSCGALVPPKPGQSSAPKQCAGTDGTLISAEDLFYNVPQRRRALRSGAEEYNRALDVAAKYAVHYGGRGVGFTCRKAGSNMTDLNTPASPGNTTLDAIRLLHGNSVARELIELTRIDNQQYGFRCQGWISGANWSSKRSTMLCFINNRLVDCPLLKRSLEAVYSTVLPKGGHPWIYVSLEIDPEHVDVNVHPTKREVHFLNEEEVVEAICSHAQTCLAGANSSRTFHFSQALLPGATASAAARSGSGCRGRDANADDGQETPYDEEERDAHDRAARAPSSKAPSSLAAAAHVPASQQKGYPQHMVRVDARTRTLDSMFGTDVASATTQGQKRSSDTSTAAPSTDSLASVGVDEGAAASVPSAPPSRKRQRSGAGGRRIVESDVELTSIRELRSEMQRQKHGGLVDIVNKHAFVGVVDLDKSLSLVQHETRLYLLGHAAYIEEFAYQLVIRQFGSLQRVRLDPPASLEMLVHIGLEAEAEVDVDADGADREQLVKNIADTLLDNAEMLDEYFSLGFDVGSRSLAAIPCLLPFAFSASSSSSVQDGPGTGVGVGTVTLDRLPALMARLGPMVDWQDEKTCFETVARELAFACLPAPGPPLSAETEDGNEEKAQAKAEHQHQIDQIKRQVQTWFTAMSSAVGRFWPPKSLVERDTLQVANLPDLYRVFERC